MKHYFSLILLFLLLSVLNQRKICAKTTTTIFTRSNRSKSALHSPKWILTKRRSTQSAIRRDSLLTSTGATTNGGGNFWPPWPLDVLLGKERDPDQKVAEGYREGAKMVWKFTKQRVRVGARQLQDVFSDLSFHLPPAAPPLFIISMLPMAARKSVSSEGAAVSSRLPPLFSNPFARKLAFFSLAATAFSWAHDEINKNRNLVPLPLANQYTDYKRAILPPFLPEHPPPLEPVINTPNENLQEMEKELFGDDEEIANDANIQESSTGLDSLPRLRKTIAYLYKAAPTPQALSDKLKEWRRLSHIRRRRFDEIRRTAIMDELISLQSSKQKTTQTRKRKFWSRSSSTSTEYVEETKTSLLGYALVTGASRGIGRAIAVELARWEIPLILVARDLDNLNALANDLETCYGVRCCVLRADLSQPGAAAKIHNATTSAGLPVDILVNNAGLCKHGEMVETDTQSIEDIIGINAASVAILSRLYGKDMKRRGRGRILFVSSVVGVTPAAPGVATYSATKAFEKTLAMSMRRELEQYGVGVTCVMPGAVGGTAFASRSETEEAACWKFPYYPRPAPEVATRAVRGMLDGDPEVFPGWQNRLFLKAFVPVLPQRLTTLIVEFAWNPLDVSSWSRAVSSFTQRNSGNTDKAADDTSDDSELPPVLPSTTIPPRELRMPEDEKKDDLTKAETAEEEEEIVLKEFVVDEMEETILPSDSWDQYARNASTKELDSPPISDSTDDQKDDGRPNEVVSPAA